MRSTAQQNMAERRKITGKALNTEQLTGPQVAYLDRHIAPGWAPQFVRHHNPAGPILVVANRNNSRFCAIYADGKARPLFDIRRG